MGIKLKTAADAVNYLREQAWQAVESRKGNRAERLHFCADLIAIMGQDLADAEEMTAEMMEEPTAASARISTLLDVRRKLEDVLGPDDRINLAELAYDAIDMMIEDALFDGSGGEPQARDCPECCRRKPIRSSLATKTVARPNLDG